MDNYISKPIDDKLLYKMIMDHVKINNSKTHMDKESNDKMQKHINLDYLKELTAGKQEGMVLMIKAYLEETPTLIKRMKNGIEAKDWDATGGAAHSIIPSFSMLGMDKEYEKTARMIQDYTTKKENLEKVKDLFLKIEEGCSYAISDLEKELITLEDII